MERSRIISRTVSSCVFAESENKVVKVINQDWMCLFFNYFFSKQFHHKNILSPESVIIREGKVHITMQRGNELRHDTDLNPKKLISDILEGLCYLESFGLIHGDIKPQNIVEYQGNFCLIDFDIFCHFEDNDTLTQSFNDIYGYFAKERMKSENYNNFHQALYAITYTAMIYCSEKNREFYYKDKPESCSMEIEGNTCSCFCSKTAYSINKNPDKWITRKFPEEWRDFATKCVGRNLEVRFRSFREARNHPLFEDFETQEYSKFLPKPFVPRIDQNNSRKIYKKACKLSLLPSELFSIYNLYYRYEVKNINALFFLSTMDFSLEESKDLVIQDNCQYICDPVPKDVELILLEEYLVPGSWLHQKDRNLSTLERLLHVQRLCETERCPKKVINPPLPSVLSLEIFLKRVAYRIEDELEKQKKETL